MVYENYDAKSLEPNLNDLASRLGKSGNILIFRGYLNNLHDNNDKQNTFIDLIKTIRKIGIWDMEDVGVVGKYTGGLFRSRPQLLFRRTTKNGYTAPNSQLAAIPLAGDIEIILRTEVRKRKLAMEICCSGDGKFFLPINTAEFIDCPGKFVDKREIKKFVGR